MRVAIGFIVTVLALVLATPQARADVWSYTDADGVVHFTNVKPKRKGKRNKWKRVMRSVSSKATTAARRSSRADTVSAKDDSPHRFSRYDEFIYEAADLYQIPVSLIRAVIQIESDYDPRVVSSKGARGLMQLMPAAASDMRVDNVHDPRENIFGGVRYLRLLANKFDGDLVLTIAAYHSGGGKVSRYMDVPPYPRVRKYVRMVLDRYYRYREAEAQ